MNFTVKQFFELLFAMTQKELRARYKYTLLGFFWLVGNPFLQMIVIGFIFTFVLKQTIQYYYYYLFVGLMAWNFFSLSITKATSSIVYERQLIKKSMFPKSIIPLSIICANFIHLVAALLLVTLLIIPLQLMTFLDVGLILVALLFLFTFTTGMCLLTTALNVRFRDVNFFVQAILILWFYGTPIVYTFSSIPPVYAWVWRFNPMTSIVQLLQYAFVKAAAPGVAMIAINALIIIGVSLLGIAVFSKESKTFDDWV